MDIMQSSMTFFPCRKWGETRRDSRFCQTRAYSQIRTPGSKLEAGVAKPAPL